MMKDKSQQQNVSPDSVSSAPVQLPPVRLRAAIPSDDDFLLEVFASTRSDELAEIADSARAQAFLRMQFTTQGRTYRAAYSSAENNIILLGEEPIGRMLVEKNGDKIALVDIAILPEHRNAGIGRALIQDLQREGHAAGKPVGLHVFKFSRAVGLYERLGFSTIGSDSAYLEMVWLPDSKSMNSSETHPENAGTRGLTVQP